ncbi:hypothetical protein OC846_002154 [Tilletia horrida]|uniref:Uncharacterized protein n=1 Tax=Tilletia horrida TaxID=155126 RepID=A0AAN6JZ74_9BASI|nr:hypothetical protein OC846_002154 [Tilletia horrida]
MPVCTVLLLSLEGGYQSIDSVLSLLKKQTQLEVLTAAYIHRTVIRSTSLDTQWINEVQWHLLLVVKGADQEKILKALPPGAVAKSYSVTAGVPSKIYDRYRTHTVELRDRSPPALTSSTQQLPKSLRGGQDGKPRDSQNLEVSEELLKFADELESKEEFRKPVVMLNLLQFAEGQHESYKKYGKGFAKIGARHGGDAKLVGLVVPPPADFSVDSRADRSRPAAEWWSEVAYAFYPTIRHFVDMAADPEYQDINQKYRLPALRDTTILCTTEIEPSRFTSEARTPSAKL